MSDLQQRMQEIKDRFMPNGTLDKDHVQRILSEELQGLLLLRTPDQTIGSIITNFGNKYETQLSWLGDAQKRKMLREAMESTSVDLSKWIGKE